MTPDKIRRISGSRSWIGLVHFFPGQGKPWVSDWVEHRIQCVDVDIFSFHTDNRKTVDSAACLCFFFFFSMMNPNPRMMKSKLCRGLRLIEKVVNDDMPK